MDGHVLWDYRVVLDLFFGGIGIGAFILGAVLYLVNKDAYKQVSKVAFTIAPVFVVIGLLLLMSKLGRPMNAHAMMLNFNPSSIMSWGGILQGVFVVVSLFVLFKAFKGEAISSVLLYVGIAFATLVGIYHGGLLSSFGVSAWNFALPALFFVTSIAGGVVLSLLVAKLGGANDVEGASMPSVIAAASLLGLLLTITWVYGLAATNAESYAAYEYLFSGYYGMFMIAIVLGMLVPLVLSVLSLVNKQALSQPILFAVSASVIVGTFFLKYIVVYVGQLKYML